jgi:hypothetical protein
MAHTAAAQPPATPDGANLYRNNCAACHGMAGEGDGPVASAMRVTIPNLRTLASRNDGEFPRDAVTAYIDGRTVPAAHGDRYMPVWGDVLAPGTMRDIPTLKSPVALPPSRSSSRSFSTATDACPAGSPIQPSDFSTEPTTRTRSASERMPSLRITRALCSSTVR